MFGCCGIIYSLHPLCSFLKWFLETFFFQFLLVTTNTLVIRPGSSEVEMKIWVKARNGDTGDMGGNRKKIMVSPLGKWEAIKVSRIK